MAPKIDPAILKALSLDAATTTITTHGGSGFASTFKLSTKDSDGNEKLYFVKMGKGKDSEVMFAGEHTSLNAIHSTVPSLCPVSHAHGNLSSGNGSFLATDFLNLSASGSSGSGQSLAQKLAKLHSTPAPVPEGYEEPQFGFPVPTCCGDTQQDNSYRSSWAEFYADCRLRHILKCAEKNNGKDSELDNLVEKTALTVVPRLLKDGYLKGPDGRSIKPVTSPSFSHGIFTHPTPPPPPQVVIHGDLWSGNHGRGTIDKGGLIQKYGDGG
ncbi:related to fructosamine-3-kinase [Phialocephala subalpina]|uniref:protein-ribulosamine 3-kinase n=1 Tax=Phialocephala subalpina TaxID=576137 RepID=A0A1L7WM59_9HELO|nr:related to fructosamine-3-kinase [Phialocephala subalpina]